MRKWLIGGGVVSALAVVLLVGSLVVGAFAQSPTPPAPPQATITPEDAEAAALAANPGATVIDVELENENGALVYEVELDNGLEVMVDASDGTVLGTEQDDADEADDPDDVQEEFESQVEDADDEPEADDMDDAEDEFESEADDALETPGIEDTPGQ